jgi:membrane peptidoglycan carboxypeptidase
VSTRRFGRIVADLLGLVVCGSVVALLLASAALPAITVAGMGTASATDSFDRLPSELKARPLDQNSVLYDAVGHQITTFYESNRVIIAPEKIPPLLRHVTVAAEDQRFYQHKGVDPRGILRALVENERSGGIQQGASTLTQQYVRQLLVQQADSVEQTKAATSKNYGRKLREIRYAVALEKELSKDEILGRYLNIAFYGNDSYGIVAAARAYFSKTPDQLSLAEAATLAGLVQNPGRLDPVNNPPAAALTRRNYILDATLKLGYASAAEVTAAKAEPLVIKRTVTTNGCARIPAASASSGFFCDWFVEWWKSNPAFGTSRQEREQRLKTGGFRIRTSLDSRMQKAATGAALAQLSANSEFATGIVLVEPGTGRIKAMAVNRRYGIDESRNPPHPLADLRKLGRKATYPVTSVPLLTGTRTSPGYQAGSTFKMFTMVAALEKGYPLGKRYYAPAQFRTNAKAYAGDPNCGGNYCPKNASKSMTGMHTMWSGFGESVNTYFVQLEQAVGVRAAANAARKLGVVFRQDHDDRFTDFGDQLAEGNQGLSFTLGTPVVTPLDMATAYATVAARGKYCAPTPVLYATDANGAPQPWSSPSCRQVISPQVADAATDAARCPTGQRATGPAGAPPATAVAGQPKTATPAAKPGQPAPAAAKPTALFTSNPCVHPGGGVTGRAGVDGITRPMAGKTGSTDSNRSSWYVGYSPNLAAAAFIADPDSPLTQVPSTRVPYEVFNQAMSSSLQGLPVARFTPPTPKYRAWA